MNALELFSLKNRVAVVPGRHERNRAGHRPRIRPSRGDHDCKQPRPGQGGFHRGRARSAGRAHHATDQRRAGPGQPAAPLRRGGARLRAGGYPDGHLRRAQEDADRGPARGRVDQGDRHQPERYLPRQPDFGRQMLKQQRGSIINTCSMTTFVSFGESPCTRPARRAYTCSPRVWRASGQRRESVSMRLRPCIRHTAEHQGAGYSRAHRRCRCSKPVSKV